jgi:hypothetical protein
MLEGDQSALEPREPSGESAGAAPDLEDAPVWDARSDFGDALMAKQLRAALPEPPGVRIDPGKVP